MKHLPEPVRGVQPVSFGVVQKAAEPGQPTCAVYRQARGGEAAVVACFYDLDDAEEYARFRERKTISRIALAKAPGAE